MTIIYFPVQQYTSLVTKHIYWLKVLDHSLDFEKSSKIEGDVSFSKLMCKIILGLSLSGRFYFLFNNKEHNLIKLKERHGVRQCLLRARFKYCKQV